MRDEITIAVLLPFNHTAPHPNPPLLHSSPPSVYTYIITPVFVGEKISVCVVCVVCFQHDDNGVGCILKMDIQVIRSVEPGQSMQTVMQFTSRLFCLIGLHHTDFGDPDLRNR